MTRKSSETQIVNNVQYFVAESLIHCIVGLIAFEMDGGFSVNVACYLHHKRSCGFRVAKHNAI
jgi:hypothetical protein